MRQLCMYITEPKDYEAKLRSYGSIGRRDSVARLYSNVIHILRRNKHEENKTLKYATRTSTNLVTLWAIFQRPFKAFEDALEARDTEDWTTDAKKNLPSGEDH